MKHSKRKHRLKGTLCAAFATAVLATGCRVHATNPDPGQVHAANQGRDKAYSAPAFSDAPDITRSQPDVLKAFGQNAKKAPADKDPFGMEWKDVLQRQQEDLKKPHMEQKYKKFVTQFDAFRHESLLKKASNVNSLVVRKVSYKKDTALYKKADYWATPVETAMHRAGDCEDYTILQYSILRHLGVPDNRLFLAAVNSDGKTTSIDHMLLLVNVAPANARMQLVILNDAAPVIKADNSIVSKTWHNADNSIVKYVLFDARNARGFWRTRYSGPATGKQVTVVAKSAPKPV